MAIVIEIPCPGCDRIIKVPESAFGKKIKCKHCGEKIEVEEVDPDELEDDEDRPKPKKKPAAKEDKPAAAKPKKKEEPKPPPPAPAPAPYKFADEDDEGDGGAVPKPLGVVDEGEDIPRCPHCAKELDPPDAIVCVHCGFNNQTRTKAESRKTWAPTAEDWFQHLGPGVLALVGCIALIALAVSSYLNMEDWLADSFLQNEKPMGGGKVTFIARANDAFTMFIIAATIMPIIKLGRFAIKRLAIDNKPEEKVKV